MAYQARWGPKGFIVSTNKVVTLGDLSTSLTLKKDSENDTSGTQPTNTRGRELRPITFKVDYIAAAGVDPRDQIKQWEAELGNAYPLLIGGKRFGAEKMMLTSVSTSDVQLTNNGRFASATVSITLEEYSEGKTSKLVKKSSSGGSAASKAAATYAATVENKKAALNATASSADKAAKKPTGRKEPLR